MTEYARKICKRLHAYARMGVYRGRITAVAPTVLRIETDIGVISVLSNTNCLQPFSLTINQTKPFTSMELAEGQKVVFEDEKLFFADNEMVIDVSQATDIELSIDVLKSLFLPLDLNIRIRHLVRVIDEGGGVQPLAALATDKHQDLICESVNAQLPKLYAAVYEQSLPDCAAAAAAVAGYGNGTTPDSDDLLEGFIAGYSALSMALGRSADRVRALTREIATAAAQHTTEISSAFLLQAGEGLVNEDVFQLMQSIFSDASYRAIVADATKVTKSTVPSGINILVGIYLAVTTQYIPARTF